MTARIHDTAAMLARLTVGNPEKSAALFAVLEGDTEGKNLLAQVLKVDPGPDTPPRFTVYTAQDALQPQPPVEYIVDKIISTPSVSVVFGESGGKKTYVMMDLSVCVSSGKKWTGFAVKQCPVLFVDEESGHRRFARRLSDCLRGHMVDTNPPPLYYTTLAQLNICDPADVAGLKNLILEKGARLVVIDSWIASARGIDDENKAPQVQAVFNLLKPMAEETNAAIVLIHHANRNGGYRGSSAMKGATDMMLFCESKADSPNIDFSFEKARDVEPFTFSAVAHFGDGSFFLAASEPVQRVKPMGKAQEYVVRYLTEHGPSNIETIMGAADVCSDAQARRAVYSLADQGKVKRIDRGGKGARAVYALAEGN